MVRTREHIANVIVSNVVGNFFCEYLGPVKGGPSIAGTSRAFKECSGFSLFACKIMNLFYSLEGIIRKRRECLQRDVNQS